MKKVSINWCKHCRGEMLSLGVTCVQCRSIFHMTCAYYSYYVKYQTRKTVLCCEKKTQYCGENGAKQNKKKEQQKFLKRSADELDPGGGGPSDSFEPPVKLQCTTQQQQHQNPEGLTKFSVEIVQQLEFTTSAASAQPQQISTNVTVKTHANASVKSDVSSPKSTNPSPAHPKPNIDVGTLVECVKQEPDNDFADLDQCAAALEKDAAGGFGGFPDLIGDDTNDEIISSATFNDLISDISNYPDYELMKDFDFDDKSESGSKLEDVKEASQQSLSDAGKQQQQIPTQSNYSQPVFDKTRMATGGGYPNMDFSKTELSPAAQTLKQMAEQHQHKNQLGLSFAGPNAARVPTARSPYPDFPFQTDYGSPTAAGFHKGSPGFSQQPDLIKQEIFQGADFADMKRKGGIYKQQQYSPYGSPSSHGSPGYLPPPRAGAAPNPGAGPFGGGTPPRPSSGPGGNNSGASVQINQAQQLNISQQGHGHTIQVSAGQHVHLSGDLKGNVSIAAQQGMHFSHHSSQNGGVSTSQSSSTNNQQQHHHQRSQQSPLGTPQHQNSPMHNSMGSQNSMNHQSGSHLGGDMHPGSQQMSGSQQQSVGGGIQGMGGMPASGNMPGSESMSGNMGMPNMGHGSGMSGLNSNLGGPGGLPSNMSGSMGGAGGMPGSMGGMHPGMHHVGGMGGGHSDTYSLSQTQTINFTQQSLRRAGGPGVGNPMGASVPMGPGPMPSQGNMGPRLLNAAQQSLEQQKLLHQQQQLMRAQQQQQAAMQQQQQQQHMVRPPPPEYKASAGMMQGMQPRYAATPPNIRRMPHQPMPPSGPMMRSNMFLLPQQQQQQQQQQQHQSQMQQRTVMYARQQGPLPGLDQHNSSEWRHLLMAQQQSSNFNPMRPNFQQGFNVNSNNIQQMSVLQHQQLRSQQGMVSGSLGGQQSLNQGLIQGQVLSQNNSPMTQMNNMNQAMLHMQQQQQQQQNLMQQHNSHMSMSNIHMQQSQSLSVSNQQQTTMNNQLSGAPSNPQNNILSTFNPQADFNFEFLDNLTTGDSGTFTDQDLLNSFDSDAGFNLDF
ncbi:uncharacterized protein isoform X3 [Leptinotarsa decemlineata]|uniref:uncharacterized protein isoform X3 n=1 Tax=Leptinotarsa decemlineata TaxID=7539 RepID=UPI000C251B3A|nr:neurogenic protein mastermind-like isoform X3 [Leptinotarsa decemlineata]